MVASRVSGKRPHAPKSPVATTASWDLEKDDVQADPTAISGRLIRLGEMSDDDAQSLHRGTGGSTHTRKAYATREAPSVVRDDQPDAREGRAGRSWGGGEARSTAEAG